MGRHERHIQRAIDTALTSTYRWQLGAVITRGGRVLSVASNKFRNPPQIDPNHATLHAEIAALKKYYYIVRGGTIYIARTNRLGETRLAKPCDRCLEGLQKAGIRTMVYTTNDGSGSFLIEKCSIAR